MQKLIIVGSFLVATILILVPYTFNIDFDYKDNDATADVAAPTFDIESKKEVIQSSWMLTEEDHKDFRGMTGVFIHNNGKPLKTNRMKEKRGNELFAVYKATIEGEPYTIYIHENRKESDLPTLKKRVTESVIEAKIEMAEQKAKDAGKTASSLFKPMTVSAHDIPHGGGYTKNRWYFYDRGEYRGSFVEIIEFIERDSTSSVNGRSATIWDHRTRLNWNPYNKWDDTPFKTRTRLSVEAYDQQGMLDYGPEDDWAQTVNVSLTPLSWSFDVDAYETDAMSNFYRNYGRWEWTKRWGYPDPFITRPGMRTFNHVGDYWLDTSHYIGLRVDDHYTGVNRYQAYDR